MKSILDKIEEIGADMKHEKYFATRHAENAQKAESVKCLDLDLVQTVGSAITKAICAKNPTFKGAGVLDATNAAIEIITSAVDSALGTSEQ